MTAPSTTTDDRRVTAARLAMERARAALDYATAVYTDECRRTLTEPQARTLVGTNGTDEFLVEAWDADTFDVKTRPLDSGATWSPPVRMTELVG